MRTMQRGKFTTLSVFIKKVEIFNTDSLTSHMKILEQNKEKASERGIEQSTIKIKNEINTIDTKRITEQIDETTKAGTQVYCNLIYRRPVLYSREIEKKKEEWNRGEETGVEGRKTLVGVSCVKEETNYKKLSQKSILII